MCVMVMVSHITGWLLDCVSHMTTKETSVLCIASFLWGEPSATNGFPSQKSHFMAKAFHVMVIMGRGFQPDITQAALALAPHVTLNILPWRKRKHRCSNLNVILIVIRGCMHVYMGRANNHIVPWASQLSLGPATAGIKWGILVNGTLSMCK